MKLTRKLVVLFLLFAAFLALPQAPLQGVLIGFDFEIVFCVCLVIYGNKSTFGSVF
jgi:hypothetical protein